MCLGAARDLRADGVTQKAVTVGDVPVLLVWADDDVPAAFANTCRHRGHELLPDGAEASKRAIVCPYHAWSYGLDGALIAAPGCARSTSFDPDGSTGWCALPVEVWHGWLFVNADAARRPLRRVTSGRWTTWSRRTRPSAWCGSPSHDYVVAANWKVVDRELPRVLPLPADPPRAVPGEPTDERSTTTTCPAPGSAAAWTCATSADTMSLDGRSARSPASTGADPRRVLYLGLLPNLLLSLHPDYVMTHRLEPLSPGRTRIECSWYFPDEGIDPSYAVDFWDRTNRQDWAACESVQRGISSPHFRPGPLAPNEDAVHQFVTTVARGYLGARLGG